MINYNDIEQGSIEWHEMRWGKIGGTLSKGLFMKSDTLQIDVLSQRMEDFEPYDSFTNEAMERGNDMEPFAREYLENYTGIKFNKSGWLQCEENELLGNSPDGISECETVQCEIKCFGRKKHFEVLLNNEIPLENISQCLHYFTVNPKLRQLYFIAFRPEAPKHFIICLELESIINLGTKARPILQTISESIINAKENANELLLTIKKLETKLKF
jgi:hypothetical protein